MQGDSRTHRRRGARTGKHCQSESTEPESLSRLPFARGSVLAYHSTSLYGLRHLTGCVSLQGDSRTHRRRSARTGKRSQSESAVPAQSEEPKRASKRVRIGVVDGGQSQSGQHVIAGLRKLEGLPGRPPPGTLLLAQDPRSLNRYTSAHCVPLSLFQSPTGCSDPYALPCCWLRTSSTYVAMV